MSAQRKLFFWLSALLVAVLIVLLLSKVLLPFIAGLVIAYALNPLADRLERFGLPRLVASIVVVAVLVLTLILALVLLAPLIARQAGQFVASAPAEIERLGAMLDAWGRARLGERYAGLREMIGGELSSAAGQGATLAGVLARSLWDQGRALIDFVAILLITPLVVFYLLVDWAAMLARIDGWLPRDHRDTIRRLAGEIDTAIAAFIRGQGLVCLLLGTFYAVALSAVDLKYGVLIGVGTGLLAFVPIVGWTVGLLAAGTLALVQGWPDPTLFVKVLAIFLAGQVLDAGILSPRIVGPSIGLHPVGLIFALMMFSALFGVVGVLVAVPLAAAAMVLVRFGLALYLNSDIYRGENSVERGAAPNAHANAPSASTRPAP